MKVWLLEIDSRDYVKREVYIDEESARLALHHYVDTNWEFLLGDESMPRDKEEAVDQFFNWATEESYKLRCVPVLQQSIDGQFDLACIDAADDLFEALRHARTIIRDLTLGYPFKELHESMEDTVDRATEALLKAGWENDDEDEETDDEEE